MSKAMTKLTTTMMSLSVCLLLAGPVLAADHLDLDIDDQLEMDTEQSELKQNGIPNYIFGTRMMPVPWVYPDVECNTCGGVCTTSPAISFVRDSTESAYDSWGAAMIAFDPSVAGQSCKDIQDYYAEKLEAAMESTRAEYVPTSKLIKLILDGCWRSAAAVPTGTRKMFIVTFDGYSPRRDACSDLMVNKLHSFNANKKFFPAIALGVLANGLSIGLSIASIVNKNQHGGSVDNSIPGACPSGQKKVIYRETTYQVMYVAVDSESGALVYRSVKSSFPVPTSGIDSVTGLTFNLVRYVVSLAHTNSDMGYGLDCVRVSTNIPSFVATIVSQCPLFWQPNHCIDAPPTRTRTASPSPSVSKSRIPCAQGPYPNKYLQVCASDGCYNHATLAAAMTSCLADSSCGGVTQTAPTAFQKRAGTVLMDSPSGEISWLRGTICPSSSPSPTPTPSPAASCFSAAMANTFIGGCAANNCRLYTSLSQAQANCLTDATCTGVVKAGTTYSSRSDTTTGVSASGETTWLKVANCLGPSPSPSPPPGRVGCFSAPIANTFLSGCARDGCTSYTSLAQAQAVCRTDTLCTGVVQSGTSYSLRSSSQTAVSPSGETTWLWTTTC